MKKVVGPLVVLFTATTSFLGVFGCSAAPGGLDPDPNVPEFGEEGASFVGPAPAWRGEALVTDRLRYEAARARRVFDGWEYEFTVIARFTNPTADTLFVGNCMPGSRSPIHGVIAASGDRKTRSVFSGVRACVGHDQQLAVAPGASRTDTLLLSGPNGYDGRTHKPIGVFEGWFRLTYSMNLERDNRGATVPDSLTMSNVIEIKVER